MASGVATASRRCRSPPAFSLIASLLVGLPGELDSIGHFCTCDVVLGNPDADGKGQCLARKLEDVQRCDPTERHVGVTLVYMGGRSKFCLVQ